MPRCPSSCEVFHGADHRAVRTEVMRYHQHRVADEEMPIRDLVDRLAIPRIAQHCGDSL